MGEAGPRTPPALPPQATLGLLAYLSTHTLDEDYAYVSQRRTAAAAAQARAEGGSAGTGSARARRPSAGPMAAVVLLLFALLVATAAAQTSRNEVSVAEQRRVLGKQVEAARQRLAAQNDDIAALEAQTARLEDESLARDESTRGVLEDLTLLGTRAGTVSVRGPGVRVVVDDQPGATEVRNTVLDSDLQRLANGLWEAGAEAMSINGQRLTALSAIRLAGEAITVNNRSLRRPYVVLAIGNPDTLPARFAENSSGQAWLDLQREVGLQLNITTEESMRLPAADLPTLRSANQEPEGSS